MNLLQRVWQAARGQAVPAATAPAMLADRAYAAAQDNRASLWNPSGSSATAEVGMGAAPIARRARDAVRNDPYAARIVDLWAGNAVGAGITTRWPDRPHAEAWRRWAESTACDAERRLDLYGLQALVMRAVVESGECLVRLLPGEITPTNPIGLRLQLLESDYLDTTRNGLVDGHAVVQGIALDEAGAPTAYWLFRQHPGASWISPGQRVRSEPVPTAEVLHIYRKRRPGLGCDGVEVSVLFDFGAGAIDWRGGWFNPGLAGQRDAAAPARAAAHHRSGPRAGPITNL